MAVFLFVGTSLFAQPPCTEFPSPVIQPDFLSFCQDDRPREGQSDPGHQKEDCLLVCENSTVTYTVADPVAGNSYYWEVFGSYTSSPNGTGTSFSVTWGAAPGTGLIQVTETTPDGCATTVSECVEIIESPTADFTSLPMASGGVITVCDGTDVLFQDQSSDDVITWVWDFGDGSPVSNEADPSHVYTGPGPYTATLTVYNDCGCSDTKTVEVVVQPSQAPVISCVSTVCENDEVKYTVTNAANCPGATYNWTANGGSVTNIMDNMVWVKWDSPINGQGLLTVEILGCPDVCTIPTTVVVPILTASLTMEGPTEVCVGDQVEFQIPPQPGSLYNWSGSAASFATAFDNDHSIELNLNTPGNFTICVTIAPMSVVATDGQPQCDIGYKDFYCKNIKVLPEFEVFSNQTICTSGTASFFAGGGVSGVTWTAIDGMGTSTGIGSGTSISVAGTSLTPGFYEIRGSSSDPAFCNDFASAFLTIEPDAPGLAASALTGPDPVCPGSTHNYAATPDIGYFLTWSANGGTVLGTGNEVAITWDATPPVGGFEIVITQEAMSGQSCPSSTTFPIGTVTATAPTISGITPVCADAETSYTATGLVNVSFLEWEIPAADESLASIVGGVNDPMVTVQFNNTLGTVDLTLNYTVCNTVYQAVYPVTITAQPTLTLTVPVDDCMNDNVPMSAQLTPNPGGTTNWSWDFGDSNTDTDATTGGTDNTTNSYSNQGTYPVTVTATYNGPVCSGTVTNSALINIKPAPVVNITTTAGTNLCPGATTNTTLVASVTSLPGSSGTYTYNWSGPNGGGTGSTLPVNIADIGSYTLSVTDSGLGCVGTATINITSNCSGGTPCTGVDFTPPTNGCGPFTFNASLTGIYTFNPTWNFGDGNGATGTSVTHEYDNSGYYYVTLSAFDAPVGGNRCSVTKQVVVLHVPDFIAEFSCPGNAIQVQLIDQTDYISPATPLTYSWTYPGGTSALQDPIVTGLAAGINNITLTVTGGGATCPVDKNIDVPAPIVAAFTNDGPVCEGTPMTFTNTSVGGPITFADWDFGDGSGSNLIDAERTYSFATTGGTSTVTLMVTDAWGCTSTFQDNVTIDENVLIGNVTIDPPSNPYCPSSNPTLNASISGTPTGPTYEWGSSDGTTYPLGSLGTSNPSNTIPTTGQYVVVVQDALGCSERSDATTVIITPDPVAYIIGQDEYCVNEAGFVLDPIRLNLSANQGSDYTYAWTITPALNGMSTSALPTLTNNVGTTPGTYTFQVTLTDNNTGCSNTSAPFVVTLHDLPQGLTINNSGTCVPANLTATVTSPASVSYLWSNGDSGASTVALGGGTIEVTAYTDQGCQASETIDIGEGPDLADVAVGCYCFPEPVTWTAPEGDGYSYQWFAAGGTTPLSSSINFNITTSGEYYVVVTGPNGCSSTSDPIIVEIGDACGICKFNVELKDLICVGTDANTGGIIYQFDIVVNNFGAILNGFSGSSTQGIVSNPLTPAVIPNGSTTVTGFFTLLPGNTGALIVFSGSGAGVSCEAYLEIGDFPPCDFDPCNVKQGKDKLTCFNTTNGLSFYTFSIELNNMGNGLTNLVWYSCSGDPDVAISVTPTNLPSGLHTFTGMLQVPQGSSSECFKICGYDPVTKEECCWEIFLEIPDCPDEQKPCTDMQDLGSKLICVNPSTDPYGNPVYDFDINVASHVGNGTAYLLPSFSQNENNVDLQSFSVSGNIYNLMGTVVDVPPTDDPICFTVITISGGEICWMELCLRVPDCEPSDPCDITWYEPKLECLTADSDYTYYNFEVAATNVTGTTLTNLSWYPCNSDVSLGSVNVNSLPNNVSTLAQGILSVPTGGSVDCIRVCAYDPVTKTKCCWNLEDIRLPECPEPNRPCEDVRVDSKKLTCGDITIDPFGNRVYNIDVEITSPIPGGNGYLIPYLGQEENNVVGLSVSVSGNSYTFSGQVLDVSPYNDKLCFWVITERNGEICWTRFCIRLPDCNTEGIGQDNDAEIRNGAVSSQLAKAELNVMPNPATDQMTVAFNVEAQGQVELRMINVDGKLVHHITNMRAQSQLPLDVSSLPAGLYLVAVMQDGKMIAQEKVAIIR